jgi:hypothetical protein
VYGSSAALINTQSLSQNIQFFKPGIALLLGRNGADSQSGRIRAAEKKTAYIPVQPFCSQANCFSLNILMVYR